MLQLTLVFYSSYAKKVLEILVQNIALKHRANDARDGSSSDSNRRDESGLNGCCTEMWKADEKTTTLLLLLDSLLPKTEIYMRAVPAKMEDKKMRKRTWEAAGWPCGWERLL
jgi:hypothetical protein